MTESAEPTPRGRMAAWAREHRDLLVGVGLFAAAFAFVYGPVLPILAHALLGIEYVDHYGTQWFYWYAEHTLRQGQGPGYTDLFYFPWGKDIYAHTGSNMLDAYAAVPLRMLLGHVLGYNIFVLLGSVLAGVAAGAFAWDVTRDRLAAAVAATMLTFHPYVLVELVEGRPTQALLLLPVLFTWAMWRSATTRSWLWPTAAGILLALSGMQYWYYAFFGGMVALAHGLWRTAWPVEEGPGRWGTLGRHAWMAAVAVGLALPMGWELLVDTAAGDTPGLLDVSSWDYYVTEPVTSTGVSIGLMVWSPFNHSPGFYTSNGGLENLSLEGAYTPWAAVLLALLWLRRPGRLDRGPVLAMVVVSTLLAMGPVVAGFSSSWPNPFYIALAKQLAFVQRLWWPARAYVFIAILTPLVGAAVLADIRRRYLAIPVAVALVGWWVLSAHQLMLAPFPIWNATIPAGYHCLAGDEGAEGAIIELPFAWTQAHLYYQVAHGRPILGGMIEDNPVFAPEEAVALREENTWVRAVLAAVMPDPRDENGEPLGDPDPEHAAEARELGFRYVVLQRDAFQVMEMDDPTGLTDNALRARHRASRNRLRALLGAPVYEDVRVAIYAPWGDASPCGGSPGHLDYSSPGPPDDRAREMIKVYDPDHTRLHRLPPWAVVPVDDPADTGEATDTPEERAGPE